MPDTICASNNSNKFVLFSETVHVCVLGPFNFFLVEIWLIPNKLLFWFLKKQPFDQHEI